MWPDFPWEFAEGYGDAVGGVEVDGGVWFSWVVCGPELAGGDVEGGADGMSVPWVVPELSSGGLDAEGLGGEGDGWFEWVFCGH